MGKKLLSLVVFLTALFFMREATAQAPVITAVHPAYGPNQFGFAISVQGSNLLSAGGAPTFVLINEIIDRNAFISGNSDELVIFFQLSPFAFGVHLSIETTAGTSNAWTLSAIPSRGSQFVDVDGVLISKNDDSVVEFSSKANIFTNFDPTTLSTFDPTNSTVPADSQITFISENDSFGSPLIAGYFQVDPAPIFYYDVGSVARYPEGGPFETYLILSFSTESIPLFTLTVGLDYPFSSEELTTTNILGFTLGMSNSQATSLQIITGEPNITHILPSSSQ